jgi:anaerobic ribonucleoside-triphosphate reductase activating protein
MAANENRIRLGLHGIVPRTTANGPGVRYGIWVQGCVRHCPGCLNPSMLEPLKVDAPDFAKPSTPGWVEIPRLLDWIREECAGGGVEGITVSGGEPFDQIEALFALLAGARMLNLGVVVFTGYTKEALMDKVEGAKFFKPKSMIDILVDGAYERGDAVEGELRGSANQRMIILTDRYRKDDLIMDGHIECFVDQDGSVVYTGFSLPPTAIG